MYLLCIAQVNAHSYYTVQQLLRYFKSDNYHKQS